VRTVQSGTYVRVVAALLREAALTAMRRSIDAAGR
jgi:hypothetical protein